MEHDGKCHVVWLFLSAQNYFLRNDVKQKSFLGWFSIYCFTTTNTKKLEFAVGVECANDDDPYAMKYQASQHTNNGIHTS